MLSLVTYTYNDHDFALELLQTVGKFLQPDEIIVVDDASVLPFPELNGVRVLRPAHNLGPGQAKRLGIAEASGDLVLSMDCDIRIDRRWLHNALPLLREPGVALVGGTCFPALGDNYLSRALYHTTKPLPQNHPSTFLPGGLWLFRRQVWLELGGLADYTGRTHEDLWLCHHALAAGYILMAADKYPAYDKRRIHRRQYCRRFAIYAAPSFHTAFLQEPAKVEESLRLTLRIAIDYGKSSRELAFVYIEMLRIITLTAPGLPDQEQALGEALKFFKPYPRLLALLREDLLNLGFALPENTPENEPFFTRIFADAEALLPELEASWVDKLRAEDAEKSFDFHYIG